MLKKLLFAFATFITIQVNAQETATASLGNIKLNFTLDENGSAIYDVVYKQIQVVKPSKLGFILDKTTPLDANFAIVSVDKKSVDETWKPVWGEVSQIRNHYNQVTIHLKQKSAPNYLLNIVFKVFEDGVGFRYEFPVQLNLKYFDVTKELTEFNLTGDHKAFWIPGDFDSNEYLYTTSKLSEVDAWKLPMLSVGDRSENEPDQNAVQTPLMMKTADGLYINIHEAALVNYPSMQLHVNKATYGLSASLVPDVYGN